MYAPDISHNSKVEIVNGCNYEMESNPDYPNQTFIYNIEESIESISNEEDKKYLIQLRDLAEIDYIEF
jgi:hypothetical protein